MDLSVLSVPTTTSDAVLSAGVAMPALRWTVLTIGPCDKLNDCICVVIRTVIVKSPALTKSAVEAWQWPLSNHALLQLHG